MPDQPPRDLSGTAATFHEFSAQTRISGVDLEGRRLRKGAADAVRRFAEEAGGSWPSAVSELVDGVARSGATPLVVADGPLVMGVIELHDVVKSGIREHCAALRRMGIRTIMVTGDNRLTATAIAAEVGVDDYLAEATPERKCEFIFATTYPALKALNVTQLTSPRSAIVSAVIFNTLIIVPLLLLAVRGVKARVESAVRLSHRNRSIYGLSGIVLSWVGIKLIDICITAFRLV
jgi:high-affinity K+ transport system ATPase subunit B